MRRLSLTDYKLTTNVGQRPAGPVSSIVCYSHGSMYDFKIAGNFQLICFQTVQRQGLFTMPELELEVMLDDLKDEETQWLAWARSESAKR